MPVVSIILPTYNGEKYLRQAIESIINQTFMDWELIVVNDCSTDATRDIVEKYIKEDARIRLINNIENQKLPESLNIGFRKATGHYLTWTSDDNYYLPSALEKMVNYLHEHSGEKMVCARMKIVDVDYNQEFLFGRYENDIMCYRNCLGACFMYRYCVWTEIGEYNADKFLVEDYDYWIRVLRRYGNIAFIDECCYVYRKHGKSLTRTRSSLKKRQLSLLRIENIDWILSCNINKKKLMQMYFEMISTGVLTDQVKQKIIYEIPVLKNEEIRKEERFLIVYGAGRYGDLAFKEFGSEILCYVDRDINKIGTYKNGKIIISTKELYKYRNNCQIMIAVSEEHIYDIVKSLEQSGINRWCVYYKKEMD